MEADSKLRWNKFTARCAFMMISHPFDYARTLIQLGFEPLPLSYRTTLFGKKVLMLPSAFDYVSHIKRVDGIVGCYRGLAPKLLGSFISSAYSSKIFNGIISLFECGDSRYPENVHEDVPSFKTHAKIVGRDIILRSINVLISFPFQVITSRMMAYFISHEEGYSSLIGAIQSIYQDNGISGFFNGLVPKLVADLSSIVITTFTSYLINKYIIHDENLQPYTSPFIAFITNSIYYPFLVVSTCMSVSGSRLAAGLRPPMPHYSSSIDCFRQLFATRQHKRGLDLIYRYYTGPVT